MARSCASGHGAKGGGPGRDPADDGVGIGGNAGPRGGEGGAPKRELDGGGGVGGGVQLSYESGTGTGGGNGAEAGIGGGPLSW
jgi:hypothetical protein